MAKTKILLERVIETELVQTWPEGRKVGSSPKTEEKITGESYLLKKITGALSVGNNYKPGDSISEQQAESLVMNSHYEVTVIHGN